MSVIKAGINEKLQQTCCSMERGIGEGEGKSYLNIKYKWLLTKIDCDPAPHIKAQF